MMCSTNANATVDSTSTGKQRRPLAESLPPIAVFWDIENCGVPCRKSALAVVSRIRERFFSGHREAEFMCVCDISKENREVIQELNYAQVTVIHINAVSKNTADDKIRQALRRFAAEHPAPATVVLISGDVNFAPELSDLRYRHHLRVILIHRHQVTDALLSCAHENHNFLDLFADVTDRRVDEGVDGGVTELIVSNLPTLNGNGNSRVQIRARLTQLGNNCRGRVVRIMHDGRALIRFPSHEAMLRAKKRMDGEDVFGYKIKVQFVDGAAGGAGASPGPHSSTPGGGVSPRLSSSNGGSNKPRKARRDRTVNSPHTCSASTSNDSGVKLSSSDDTDGVGEDSCSAEAPAELAPRPYDNSRVELTPLHSVPSNGDDIVVCGPVEEIDVDMEIPTNDVNAQDTVPSSLACDAEPTPSKKTKKKKSHCASADRGGLQLTDDGHSEQNSPAAESSIVTDSCSVMDHRADQQYSLMSAHQLTPGVRYVTPVGSTLQTPFDGRTSASRHCNILNSQNFRPRDAVHFRPPSHVLNAMSGAHTMPEATPFQAIVNPRENGYSVTHNGASAPRPSSWHVSPSRGQRGGVADTGIAVGVGMVPSFRRTPGARRSNTGSSPRVSHSSQPVIVPRPLFQPASRVRTGLSCGVQTGNTALSLREFLENDLAKAQSVGTASSYPASVNSRNSMESTRFDAGSNVAGGVELVVSNLDYNISSHEWKKILTCELQQQVQILNIRMQMLPDNTSIGFVCVPSMEEARQAVAHFHRKKIGYKRIHIALAGGGTGTSVSMNSVQNEVVGLLKDVAGHAVPVSHFMELFEKQYHHGISMSELYHMPDAVEIVEREGTGRMVALVGSQSTTSPTEDEATDTSESPVCQKHIAYRIPSNLATVEMGSLPRVTLQIRSFSAQVHSLLQSHDGSLPLASFPQCFAAEFAPLRPVLEGGVPLEHLISCVSGVQVSASKGSFRKVQWAENRRSDTESVPHGESCSSPVLSQQLSKFSHEVTELLQHSPQCCLPFSRFIPTYHHHFGRQCRIANYGFTKLIDLFDAIPHVVQVMGSGSHRCVTLSHSAQEKRFTADILRILKVQASKQISVLDLPVVYEKVIGRKFDTTEYGVCFIEDALDDIPESVVKVSGVGHELVISLPHHDQTPEEVARTKRFARDVVDLLRHSPHYRMPFSKFIPAFHRHFGRQCRVASYGFTKLIELFDAIPYAVQVMDGASEKVLCLSEQELLRVLEDSVCRLLHSCPMQQVTVREFPIAYAKTCGGCLCLEDFGVSTVIDLIAKIPYIAKVELAGAGSQPVVKLVTNEAGQAMTCNVLLILMDHYDSSMLFTDLAARYQQTFTADLNITQLQNELSGFVEVVNCEGSCEAIVKLCPVQMFARDARTLLMRHGGQVALVRFEYMYLQHFHVSLSPAAYGHPNLISLLLAVPHVIALRGKMYHQQIVMLTPRFQEKLVPVGMTATASTLLAYSDAADDEELTSLQQSLSSDILSAPVPSNIPSPALMPLTQRPPSSLIRFDSLASIQDFLMLTEDEKRGLRTPLCRTPVSDLLQFAAQFLPTTMYPSTSSDALLFKVNSLPSLSALSTDSSFLRDPLHTGSLYCSADSESAGNKAESEVTEKLADLAARGSQLSSVERQPQLTASSSDAAAVNYPPMPATAQHVSEVQERILRGSSVNEDLCSPIHADTVDVGHAGNSAVDPGMVVTQVAGNTPDVFSDVSDLQECLSDVSCYQTGKVVETPRSVTNRRSRIAARFGLEKHSEFTPDTS